MITYVVHFQNEVLNCFIMVTHYKKLLVFAEFQKLKSLVGLLPPPKRPLIVFGRIPITALASICLYLSHQIEIAG